MYSFVKKIGYCDSGLNYSGSIMVVTLLRVVCSDNSNGYEFQDEQNFEVKIYK